MFIKKNTIIALTTGVYSDYCLRDHVIALTDFDVKQVKLMFLEQYNHSDNSYWSRRQKAFISWLQVNNYVDTLEENKVVELHIGSYGRVDA